jgi:hypothetical protein
MGEEKIHWCHCDSCGNEVRVRETTFKEAARTMATTLLPTGVTTVALSAVSEKIDDKLKGKAGLATGLATFAVGIYNYINGHRITCPHCKNHIYVDLLGPMVTRT